MHRLLFLMILSALTQASLLPEACAQAPSHSQRPAGPAKPIVSYAATDQKALLLPDSATGSTEGIARYINSHFSSNGEKVRANFIWVASNIRYDLGNMFAINFYEKKQDKIDKPLKTRQGICENYAALFNDICSRTGIRSYIIEGYTKQNGFADYIPHAWCAAYIDTAWYLFDPTWGSGYVSNGRFVRKINNDYFQVRPSVLIRSHMPFDYLWQFLNYPVTNQEFYEGRTEVNKTKPFFSYPDSLAVYDRQSELDYYAAAVSRIENNGVKNSLIYDRLQHLRREIELDRQNQEVERKNGIVNMYNSALADYNKGVNSFNDFIAYRNKKFTPMMADSEIQAMLDDCARHLKNAGSKLGEIKNPDPNIDVLLVNFRKELDDLVGRLGEQQDWLKKYFSKGKSGRKGTFTKYIWLGIPLN